MGPVFDLLEKLWRAGVAAVQGERAVAEALRHDGALPASLVIAVGKAACGMFLGAKSALDSATRSIIVTKYGHVDPACRTVGNVEIIEAGHPVPDEQSLIAGQKILAAVSGATPTEHLLLLVSGGASALAECLEPGHGLDDLRAVTDKLLSSGQAIAEINATRERMSRIKGGKLLAQFPGAAARVYALSDVQGDALRTIGSGIGDPALAKGNITARVIASNSVARHAVASEAGKLGYPVRVNEESLYRDVPELAAEIASRLLGGAQGVYIWGGESTIKLPPNPGSGGRNQSLVLAIAMHLRGSRGISVLVAGTDGTDGPTDAAGAFVDGGTVDDAAEAEAALQAADAGSYLGRRNCLFKPGPTNTNVMDLVVAVIDQSSLADHFSSFASSANSATR